MTANVMTRRLTVTMLALATVAVGVPQAQATFPGRTGALMVWGDSRWIGSDPRACQRRYPNDLTPPRLVGRVADEDQGSDNCRGRPGVFLAGPGSLRVRLLSDHWSVVEGDLSLSPRHTRVAFTSGRYLRRGLEVVTLGGDVRARWLGVPGQPESSEALAPSWSPDGQRLAYEEYSPCRSTDCSISRVRIVRPGGGGRTLATGCAPVWSARNWLAFYRIPERVSTGLEGCVVRSVRQAGIFVIRPDGTGLRRIVRGSLVPSPSFAGHPLTWSPDGRALAFAAGNQGFTTPTSWLYRVGADGRGLRRIAETLAPPETAIHRPVWSPDGRWIAFSYGSGAANTFLMRSSPRHPLRFGRCRKVVANAVPLDWQALPTRRNGR